MSLLMFAPFQPTPGLAIWSLIIFCIFWFGMYKMAFKPIVSSLNKRENDIQTAIDEAKLAREEMANMKSENEQLLQEAREQRAAMLNEAKETKNQIIGEAKEKAKAEANKIVADARVEIENQKKAAIAEVKNSAGLMALNIAEKVIKKDLAGDGAQQALVQQLVNEISNN